MQEIVGRDAELEAIERWLEDPRPTALLVEGEAGIGKTTLWRCAVRSARERGYLVLSSAAVSSEAQLSYTALRDLLGELFDDISEELPVPQRDALAVTLLRREPVGALPDPGAISVAFLTAVHALAARYPTVLAIDDSQWVDKASAGPLSYALRRLQSERVAVLLARRLGVGDPRPLGVDQLGEERLRVLEVGALSVGALGRVLHDRLGTVYPRPTLHKLHETSGGNPFYALELARALEGSTPLRPGEALPVPATLQELVQERLAALRAETIEALGVVAALSRPSLAQVADALGRDPAPDLELAVEAHVVELGADDVRFTHPLFAAGVYDLTSPARRREIHRLLALVVGDDEERACHLALAADAPDEEIASALEDAARTARARVVTAELYEAAARLTPDTDIQTRTRRSLAAAAALWDAGDSGRAREQLEALLESQLEGRERAEAGLLLGRVLAHFGRSEEAMELWREALVATSDPAAVAEIRCSMATLTIFVGAAAEAVRHADEAVAAARACSDPKLLADAHAARAFAAASAGDPSYRDSLQEALDLDPGVGVEGAWSWSPASVAAACALLSLDVDEMRRRFGLLRDRGRRSGDAHIELYGAYGLAVAALFEGDLRLAEELGTETAELAETTGVMGETAARLRAELDAHTGRSSEARATLNGLIDERSRRQVRRRLWQARAALGVLELAEDRATAAADELGVARELMGELELGHPSTLLALVDEVEAAAGADRREQAEEAFAAIHRPGDTPWSEPLVRRAGALLLASRGRLEEAEAELDAALALEPPTFFPLQHGRTLLLLGIVRRRARKLKAASESLTAALGTFEEIGAALWAERARAELQRIGGRTRSAGELTPSEQRVAALVAEGRSNKEVAAALVVSVHTVEAALTSIYRKLDVRSRTEMAHKLAGSA